VIPSTYCPCGNTVNFSRTSGIHFSFKNALKNAVQTHKEKKLQTSPSPWGTWTSV